MTNNPIIFKILNIYQKNYKTQSDFNKKCLINLLKFIILNKKKIPMKYNKKTPKKTIYKFFKLPKSKPFFIYLFGKKLINKFKFNNKIHCFWPLIKKKQSFIYYKLNHIKKIHKIFYTKKTKLIEKKRKQKKIYYFNFHRRTIKYFWKSQEHFKINFLKKTRYTTRKFKKKFEMWYKKNKNNEISSKKFVPLINFLLKNLIFASKTILNGPCNKKLILINGDFVNGKNHNIKLNDIVSLPENYINYLFGYFKNKFYTIKKIKKIKFIYYSNKRSQWKDLKKKNPKILFNTVYNKNIFSNNVEIDFFSSKLCLIKMNNEALTFDYDNKRHNLEKLNTYKLNV